MQTDTFEAVKVNVYNLIGELAVRLRGPQVGAPKLSAGSWKLFSTQHALDISASAVPVSRAQQSACERAGRALRPPRGHGM